MSHRAKIRWLWPALLSAVVLASASVIVSPSAAAKWAGDEPCVSASGMTLKQQYGYSAAVVTSDCTQVPVGEKWAASVPWIMDSRFEQRPSGFSTDFSTPIDDFRAKLKSVGH